MDSKSTAHDSPPRRGQGRPKAEVVRDRLVVVRVSEPERERLQGVARSAGLSVSEFLRRRAFGRPVRARVDAKAELQLRAIGVNLNQLARAANAAGQVERGHDLDRALADLRAAVAGLQTRGT